MRAQQVETSAGVLAGLLGTAGWFWALFGPTYTAYSSAPGTPDLSSPTSASLLEMSDLGQGQLVYLAVLLGCVLAVAIGACLHGARGVLIGAPILWTATLFLVAGVLISLYTVGPFLAPAALSACLACVAAARAGHPGKNREFSSDPR